MPLFDEIGKRIAQTSQSAAQKAKDLAETAKLNGMISEEQKSINNAFQQIGKAYYETYGGVSDPLFVRLVGGINDSKAKIATYSDQIKQIKGIVNCQKCGGDVPYSAPFCSSCGSPMNTAPAATDNVVLCEACGASVAANTAFCTGCGSKVGQFVDPPPLDKPATAGVEPQSSAPTVSVASQCPGCGNDLAANTMFCLNCGQKADR